MSAARFDLPRRLLAEALGTAFLLATVVGSGIMAEHLAGGNVALALLANAIPTGAMLVVLITMFGPISGAHFNPAVTLCFFMRREIGAPDALAYVAAQLVGATIGTWCAHLMFDMPILMLGRHGTRGHRAVGRRSHSDLRTGRSRSWPACAFARKRWRRWSVCTSRRPTGSPPRPRSPTPRSRSPAR